jgi:diadenosine tetraphosphatase ApaH/serine/threonine PP2A family protein phosphatase
MLVAIFSDVHANREAFEACLAHARLLRAERIVLLGDIVGYGADPVWAVETVMGLAEQGAVVLKGNHDAAVDGSADDMNGAARAAILWTRDQLGAPHLDFLAGLPLIHEEGEILYVHANGYAPASWGYVTGPESAQLSMERSGHWLTLCGHVHVPALYHLDLAGRIGAFNPTCRVDIPLLAQRQWLAVVGSVGQPRDGYPAAAYGLLDTDKRTLRYLRVPYDHERAARKILAAGLPERLADRLAIGR